MHGAFRVEVDNCTRTACFDPPGPKANMLGTVRPSQKGMWNCTLIKMRNCLETREWKTSRKRLARKMRQAALDSARVARTAVLRSGCVHQHRVGLNFKRTYNLLEERRVQSEEMFRDEEGWPGRGCDRHCANE